MPRLARLDARPSRLSLAMAGRLRVLCTTVCYGKLSGVLYSRTIKIGIILSSGLVLCRNANRLLRLCVDVQSCPLPVSDWNRWSGNGNEAIAHRLCRHLQPPAQTLWPAISKQIQIHHLPGGCLSPRAGPVYSLESTEVQNCLQSSRTGSLPLLWTWCVDGQTETGVAKHTLCFSVFWQNASGGEN